MLEQSGRIRSFTHAPPGGRARATRIDRAARALPSPSSHTSRQPSPCAHDSRVHARTTAESMRTRQPSPQQPSPQRTTAESMRARQPSPCAHNKRCLNYPYSSPGVAPSPEAPAGPLVVPMSVANLVASKPGFVAMNKEDHMDVEWLRAAVVSRLASTCFFTP